MKIRNILIGMLLLASVGCSNFLDEFSQTNIRASKISDYDELLLGSVYMPSLTPGGQTYIYPTPARSCSFFNMMDDDINGVEMDNMVTSGDINLVGNGIWQSFAQNIFGYTTWQKDVTNTIMAKPADDATWNDLYQRIAILNTILEEVDDLDNISTNEEVADYHRVKGESYFLRAQFYFILANLYGKPYNPETAATDLGVPLKITSGVEHDKDKETQFDRTPLNQIYAQVVDDLQHAVEHLSISSKGVYYRTSKEAAVLLLSRVYLYMQDWEAAKDLLEPNMDDYLLVTMDSIGEGNPFITEDNAEVIFSQGSLFTQVNLTGYAPDFCVSADLYSLYDKEHDYRTLFFEQNPSTDSIALVGKYYIGSHRSRVSDVLMLRNAEAYLNMAEACAMMGGQEGLANQYLNALRRTRIQNYTDQTYAGEQLVNEIRNERRKELCFEGHRWFDLRRYTVSDPYPYSKQIRRKYCTYETTRPYVKNTVYEYILEENDAAYTLDIPKTVKNFDTTPMPGNDRPERVPLETVENEN